MRSESRKLLLDMKSAGDLVTEFARNRTLDEYRADAMFRSAIERQLLVLGEALSQLAQIDSGMADQFDEKVVIAGFRNRLAHGYASLDDARVWSIAQNELPTLLSKLEKLLA